MFRYLSYKELVRVSNIAELIEPKPDAQIFSAGEPGDAMYVVLSGSVRLTKNDTLVAELGRGHHFGEMALVDRSVRSLTATAGPDSRLIVINRKDFYEIIKKEPELATDGNHEHPTAPALQADLSTDAPYQRKLENA